MIASMFLCQLLQIFFIAHYSPAPQIGDKDACCGFAKLHSQHAAVFKNTVLHAENGFGFASLSTFVTYLRRG
jgi:hypothetical protein